MEPDTIKAVIGALVTALASAAATSGYVLTQDVSGARQFKEAKIEELLAAEKLKQEVLSLRAQQRMLLRMLDGATLSLESSAEVPVSDFMVESFDEPMDWVEP